MKALFLFDRVHEYSTPARIKSLLLRYHHEVAHKDIVLITLPSTNKVLSEEIVKYSKKPEFGENKLKSIKPERMFKLRSKSPPSDEEILSTLNSTLETQRQKYTCFVIISNSSLYSHAICGYVRLFCGHELPVLSQLTEATYAYIDGTVLIVEYWGNKIKFQEKTIEANAYKDA